MLQDVPSAQNTHTNLIARSKSRKNLFSSANSILCYIVILIYNLNVFGLDISVYFLVQKLEENTWRAPVLQRKCPAPPTLDRLINTAQKTRENFSRSRIIAQPISYYSCAAEIICTIRFDKT